MQQIDAVALPLATKLLQLCALSSRYMPELPAPVSSAVAITTPKRKMALPTVPIYPQPMIDVTKASLAFGDRALPKLNRELKGNDAAVKQAAVFTLTDVMHKPESIASAVREGIPSTLHALLDDDSWVTRAKAAEVLTTLASHAVGRAAVLEGGMVPTLAKLFTDEQYEVRFHTHAAVEMVARVKTGAFEVVEHRLVSLLVERVKAEESHDLKGVIMDSIHWCLGVDTEQALHCNAMAVFTELLSHPLPAVRSKAARNIMELSFPLEGKQQACAAWCMPQLVQLLSDVDSAVRAQAAGAVMSVVVTTEGKKCALEAGVLPQLEPLVGDTCSEVRFNAVKAITLLAEAPEGRRGLQHLVNRLVDLYTDVENISRAAKTAVQVITWKP